MGGRHRAAGSPHSSILPSAVSRRRTTLLAVGVAVLAVASSGGLVAIVGMDGSDGRRSAVVDSALPGTPRLVRTTHAPSVSTWDGGLFQPPSDEDLSKVSTAPPPRPDTTAPPQTRPPQARRTRPVPSRSCYVFHDREGRRWRFCPRENR